jgi:hypothetical protein
MSLAFSVEHTNGTTAEVKRKTRLTKFAGVANGAFLWFWLRLILRVLIDTQLRLIDVKCLGAAIANIASNAAQGNIW